MKRMKRKELILGLEGIMVSSGLSRSELEIIEQTVDRLKADKLKIKELKAENEINLETFVKVDKYWRNNQRELSAFGYNPD